MRDAQRVWSKDNEEPLKTTKNTFHFWQPWLWFEAVWIGAQLHKSHWALKHPLCWLTKGAWSLWNAWIWLTPKHMTQQSIKWDLLLYHLQFVFMCMLSADFNGDKQMRLCGMARCPHAWSPFLAEIVMLFVGWISSSVVRCSEDWNKR